MKKNIVISILVISAVLISCTKDHPVTPGDLEVTGAIQVSVNLGKTGALRKVMKREKIEMTKLFITLSSEGYTSILDTFSLTGGSQERTERKTYGNLIAWRDGQLVAWTLSVNATDQNNTTVYSGDTVFTLLPIDTVEISMFLKAHYSMLKANFFPIYDSVTRCELNIDEGVVKKDSSFAIQALVGDTVTLSYDYLTASAVGISHNVDLNVYGRLMGIDTMLYSGDTTIVVKSGEDKNYQVILYYVGPSSLHGAATMVVTLGDIGTVTVDGTLLPKPILWNKLGSLSEVEHSEIGVNGTVIIGTGDILFDNAMFGNGMKVTTENDQTSTVYFTVDQTSPSDSWTIEVWQKPEHNSDYTGISRWTSGYECENGYLTCAWYWRGWESSLQFFVYEGSTQIIPNEQGLIHKSLIPFAANDLIHIAAVMDRNGIEGTLDIYRIYWNGVMVKSWTSSEATNYSANLKFKGIRFGQSEYPPKAYSDNLKIYNYAKTTFSDRFTE